MFIAKLFIESAVHLGHKANKWNPGNAHYLLAVRNGIHIIDLEQTVTMIRRASNFIIKVCEKRGKILCLGDPEDRRASPAAAPKGKPRTTYDGSKGRIEDNVLSSSARRRVLLLRSENSARVLWVPEALLLSSQPAHVRRNNEEKKRSSAFATLGRSLSKEAIKLQIPTIAIVDSDASPFGIQYPVPGNDEVNLYKELFLNALVAQDEKELGQIVLLSKSF